MRIHPSACIHADARIHDSVTIGPFAVVEAGVEIGPETHLAASVIVMGHTKIGSHCQLHSHAVVGDVPQDRAFHQDESTCEIGDHCILREGVTVHRATGNGTRTSVGNRCFLMTNSHVAHNCILEDDVTLVSGALLGGHVHVGKRAIISGNAAVHQFVRIGEFAIVGGLSKIVQDVPPYLMTDQAGGIVGLNVVGLVRAGVPSEIRGELKQLYRLMYRSQLSRREALEKMQDCAISEQGKLFLEFVASDSTRGFRKGKQGNTSGNGAAGENGSADKNTPRDSVAQE
ncbi:MAG: acyl-ACP--UDP-N-acetylglucosamine O-acyltransferase [Planctomycetaceae bacterium]|nr:acyl-ACP--UDP-N-acetylglucosamine O-acyltransferase [Planctomycetaceae bacterium]